jgi:hypothetical protein
MSVMDYIKKVREHFLLISVLIYLGYAIYLMAILDGPVILVYATLGFSLFSIPSFIIGALVLKHDSPIVGISNVTGFLSVGLVSKIIGMTPLFNISEVILIVFPIGVIFTWIGSVFGNFIREKTNKKGLNLNLEKGFLLGYFVYLIVFFRFL